MKFMILCDEKPTQCNHCPFFGDTPVQIASNAIDIQTKCILGDFAAGEQCPMTAVHTIFDSEMTAEAPKAPVAFCHECGQHHTYHIKKHEDTLTVRGRTFTYIETEAFCNVCGHTVYVPAINDINAQARDDAYFAAGGENKCGNTQ